MANDISISEWLKFLSPEGQTRIVAFVERAMVERGGGWLESLKGEYPFAGWILDIVMTCDADAALAEIAAAYPALPVETLAGNSIRSLHAKLREVIDKKR